MVKKEYLTWRQIEELVDRLVASLPDMHAYDAILAITRGGMVPACLISERLDLHNILVAAVMFYTDIGETLDKPLFLQFPSDPLLQGKKILVVDDVWDSGQTIMAVKERVEEAEGQPDLAVLHYKPSHTLFPDAPHYAACETDAWIVYPWEPPET